MEHRNKRKNNPLLQDKGYVGNNIHEFLAVKIG
jgi:hypothetical protein